MLAHRGLGGLRVALADRGVRNHRAACAQGRDATADVRGVNLVRRVPPRVRGLLALVVAVLFAAQELYDVLGGWLVEGIDFVPLRHAAESLLTGESVYRDPLFVYPPTAAVVLLPTALGSPVAAFAWWVVISAAALVLAAWLVARAAGPPLRARGLFVFAVALLGLLGGMTAARSLFLGNLSELLVPVAVAVLVAFHRGRWLLGCGLLAASLLVKPMLAPLVLVPLLHRRWRPLLSALLPAGALLVLSMLIVPGGLRFPAVLGYVLTGTNLHGGNAVNNLSLRGWAEGQHAPRALGVAAAVLVVAAVAARLVRALCTGPGLSPVWTGNLLLLGTLLAGGISEVHYLLTAFATTLLYLVLEPVPARVWAAFGVGLALLCVPTGYLVLLPYTDGQSWLVGAELLLFTALLLGPAAERREVAAAPRPVPVPA